MYGSVVNRETVSVWECENQKQVKYITFNCSIVFLIPEENYTVGK